MCDPVTLGLLAVSAAGAGTSVYAADKTQSNMNNVANNEIAQQNAYAQQGKNVFEQSLAQSTPQAARTAYLSWQKRESVVATHYWRKQMEIIGGGKMHVYAPADENPHQPGPEWNWQEPWAKSPTIRSKMTSELSIRKARGSC